DPRARARLRRLTGAWPGGRPPVRWVLLLAAGGTDPATVDALRRRIDGVTSGGTWRRAVRRAGFVPAGRHVALRPFVAQERTRAARLSATLSAVDLSAVAGRRRARGR
ncbi:hypothetical protein ACVU7I_16700, partial [Patulibacter sp. S7RM1-6]